MNRGDVHLCDGMTQDFNNSINNDIIQRVEAELTAMRDHPDNVHFRDLKRMCDVAFGSPRNTGSSHFVYKTPWMGDPRVNIQSSNGNAKPYQVRQVVKAIERLMEDRDGSSR